MNQYSPGDLVLFTTTPEMPGYTAVLEYNNTICKILSSHTIREGELMYSVEFPDEQTASAYPKELELLFTI